MPAPADPKPNHFVEIIAGAIAAAIAMFTAIHLGVLGTVTGSVMMSIISTAGIAIFGKTLQRAGTRLRLQRAGEALVVASPDTVVGQQPQSWRQKLADISWRRTGVAIAGTFVLSMSVLTFVDTLSAPESASATERTPSPSVTIMQAPAEAAPTVTATATQTVVVSQPTVTVIEAPPVTITAAPKQEPAVSGNSTGAVTPSVAASTPGSAVVADLPVPAITPSGTPTATPAASSLVPSEPSITNSASSTP